jgi:hypothetical protein
MSTSEPDAEQGSHFVSCDEYSPSNSAALSSGGKHAAAGSERQAGAGPCLEAGSGAAASSTSNPDMIVWRLRDNVCFADNGPAIDESQCSTALVTQLHATSSRSQRSRRASTVAFAPPQNADAHLSPFDTDSLPGTSASDEAETTSQSHVSNPSVRRCSRMPLAGAVAAERGAVFYERSTQLSASWTGNTLGNVTRRRSSVRIVEPDEQGHSEDEQQVVSLVAACQVVRHISKRALSLRGGALTPRHGSAGPALRPAHSCSSVVQREVLHSWGDESGDGVSMADGGRQRSEDALVSNQTRRRSSARKALPFEQTHVGRQRMSALLAVANELSRISQRGPVQSRAGSGPEGRRSQRTSREPSWNLSSSPLQRSTASNQTVDSEGVETGAASFMLQPVPEAGSNTNTGTDTGQNTSMSTHSAHDTRAVGDEDARASFGVTSPARTFTHQSSSQGAGQHHREGNLLVLPEDLDEAVTIAGCSSTEPQPELPSDALSKQLAQYTSEHLALYLAEHAGSSCGGTSSATAPAAEDAAAVEHVSLPNTGRGLPSVQPDRIAAQAAHGSSHESEAAPVASSAPQLALPVQHAGDVDALANGVMPAAEAAAVLPADTHPFAAPPALPDQQAGDVDALAVDVMPAAAAAAAAASPADAQPVAAQPQRPQLVDTGTCTLGDYEALQALPVSQQAAKPGVLVVDKRGLEELPAARRARATAARLRLCRTALRVRVQSLLHRL